MNKSRRCAVVTRRSAIYTNTMSYQSHQSRSTKRLSIPRYSFIQRSSRPIPSDLISSECCEATQFAVAATNQNYINYFILTGRSHS